MVAEGAARGLPTAVFSAVPVGQVMRTPGARWAGPSVTRCLFVSDLHGRLTRYRALLTRIERDAPDAVFLGGDLLPAGVHAFTHQPDLAGSFVTDFLAPEFTLLREKLGENFPRVFLVLGNDDPRSAVEEVEIGERTGLWEHMHNRTASLHGRGIYGYACVPPTPFTLKDWERYDVSRHVDPGCVSPEEGVRTVPADRSSIRWATIARDLDALFREARVDGAVVLFHAPPYRTSLDRAALDGRSVDGVPLDPHVGSIAIRRFIETKQPLLTLHGHVHESPRLTGSWSDRIGNTTMLSAAHDGPELALLSFDLDRPGAVRRELIPTA
jgi:uncharacterized protein